MDDAETIYDRVERLEEEMEIMRRENEVIKEVLRNRISKYETRAVREGRQVESILD